MKKKILCALASLVIGMTFVSCGSTTPSKESPQSSKEIETVSPGEKPQLTTDSGLFWELKTGMSLDEVIQKFGTPCVNNNNEYYTWYFDSDKTFNKFNEIAKVINYNDKVYIGTYTLTVHLEENIIKSFDYRIIFEDPDVALSAFDEFTQTFIGNEEYHEQVWGSIKSRIVINSKKFNYENTVSVSIMTMDDYYSVSVLV